MGYRDRANNMPLEKTLTPPQFDVPDNACDCHAHICGPSSIYPYTQDRIYTPPDALLSDYNAMLNTLNVRRAVLVQPSIYGTDNRAMLDAIQHASFPCRGVAVVDEQVGDQELQMMHDIGIRGVRYNMVDVYNHTDTLPISAMTKFAERIKQFGWHIELQIRIDEFPDFDQIFKNFPIDLVVGHMGYMNLGKTPQEPGFQAMVRLAEAGRCWVKLSGPYRISATNMPHDDIISTAQTLASAVPDQLIWGSDWPHTNISRPMPNDRCLFDLVATWITDTSTRGKILVDNPTHLYWAN